MSQNYIQHTHDSQMQLQLKSYFKYNYKNKFNYTTDICINIPDGYT